jgi:hypothetical protein
VSVAENVEDFPTRDLHEAACVGSGREDTGKFPIRELPRRSHI